MPVHGFNRADSQATVHLVVSNLITFPIIEKNSRDNEEHLLIICISNQFQYYSLLRLQIFLKTILEMAFANNYQILQLVAHA